MSEITSHFITIFVIVTGGFNLYTSIRGNKVNRFRMDVMLMCYQYDVLKVCQMKDNNIFYGYDDFIKKDSAMRWCWLELPAQEKMVYSIKRLRIENWLTAEQLLKLNDVHL